VRPALTSLTAEKLAAQVRHHYWRASGFRGSDCAIESIHQTQRYFLLLAQEGVRSEVVKRNSDNDIERECDSQ
jgi:retron-type reverse transcriptase